MSLGQTAYSAMGKRRRRVNKTGRSEGEQYLALGYPMTKGDAWRSLSGAAIKVFVELACRYNGANNGKLTLSYDEAARILHIGKATAVRAIAELIEKGFVKLKRKGQWYGRLANEFELTTKSCHGMPATNDWRRWCSGRTSKSSLGADTDHIEPLTGPIQHRRL